jgi:hypothetical protein
VHPFRRIARQVTITWDVWSGVSSPGAKAEWIAEATEVAVTGPAQTQPSIPVYKYDSLRALLEEVGHLGTYVVPLTTVGRQVHSPNYVRCS